MVGLLLALDTMIDIRTFTGDAIAPHLADVARLRIAVFRAFPYLYA